MTVEEKRAKLIADLLTLTDEEWEAFFEILRAYEERGVASRDEAE